MQTTPSPASETDDATFQRAKTFFGKGQLSSYFQLVNNLVDKGYAPAMTSLGCVSFDNGDKKRAIELWRQAGDKDPWALINLADCYTHGQGVIRNSREAERLYLSAHELAIQTGDKELKNTVLLWFRSTATEVKRESKTEYERVCNIILTLIESDTADKSSLKSLRDNKVQPAHTVG